jgi:hypothetical protein
VSRKLAVLTIHGAVFGKAYCPGVRRSAEGFKVAELDEEIARLWGLPAGCRDNDHALAIAAFKLMKKRSKVLVHLTPIPMAQLR